MLSFIRYTSGLGNSAIYARLRNSSGQFWDFSTLTWAASSTVNCKINMTERDDEDSTESLYTAEITVPYGGPYIQEAVLSSNGRVLGSDSTVFNVFSGMSSLPNWLRASLRKDTVDATTKGEINYSGGTFNETTDSLEALSDTSALIQSRVNNLGVTSRIQTTLTDIVQNPTSDNWIRIEVLTLSPSGDLFDPADLTNPASGAGRIYNGVGAEFTDIYGNNVTMYKTSSGAPLDIVTLCHHASGGNNPQIFMREGTGMYYFWVNATGVGNALPLGQLHMIVGMFDISQENATYSTSPPYLITATSSHFNRSLFAVSVTDTQLLENIQSMLTRSLGLTLENHYETNIARDYLGNKTSSIMEIYNSSENANLHDGITGLIAKYQVTVTYTNGSMSSFLTTRIA